MVSRDPIPTTWKSLIPVEPAGGKVSVPQLSGGACGAAGEKPQLQRELHTLPAGLGEENVRGHPQQLDIGVVTAGCPLPLGGAVA